MSQHIAASTPTNESAVAPALSIVTPAHNEEKNLAVLHRQFCDALDATGVDWEWWIVDDHSTDRTQEEAKALQAKDPRIQYVRFARNFGAHQAALCGLIMCRGSAAVVMASDLQDPPESIPALMERWKAGNHVVWAVRSKREGETRSTILFSRLFYYLMRTFAGFKTLPPSGADFWLVDRRVIDTLKKFHLKNMNLGFQIMWMGFRQDFIYYDKKARLHGTSGWSLSKKIKLAVDSIISFSYLPLRMMTYLGAVSGLAGILYAILIVFNVFFGAPVQGWSSLMAAVLIIGGIQMFMMGILGEYLWRVLSESKDQPSYWLEDESIQPIRQDR